MVALNASHKRYGPLLASAALFCLAVLVMGSVSAQTTGFVREKLLKNASLSCQEKQKDQLPKGTSDNVIQSYCDCNATYIADKLTNEEVFTLQSNTPPGPPESLVKAANQSCAKLLKKN